MFETLSQSLTQAIKKISGQHKLSESNIETALTEIRKALLGADVHFRVVKSFTESVKQQCLGQKVTDSVTPGQQMVKIMHDAIVELLGTDQPGLCADRPLHVMMVGLHGSGKTTSCVKLAAWLKKKGIQPFLIACDVYRPAAIDQLELLAAKAEVPVYSQRNTQDVDHIAQQGLDAARQAGAQVVIIDTAGRLQIDTALMQELVTLKQRCTPQEILLVADSALGQEAVNVAGQFHEQLDLTGIILTKLDGDARGGAALSMKATTGVPIKFIGSGEKIHEFDLFYPERLAQRILGMGDIVSLVEKAQAAMDEDAMEGLAKKMMKGQFDLEDMLVQLQQLKKMGPLSSVMKLLPGLPKTDIGPEEEKQLRHKEAILLSMTPQERKHPKLFNGHRRLRVARGSGTTVTQVNALLLEHQAMQNLLKKMAKGKGGLMQQFMKTMGNKLPLPRKR
jgi:signal recognition particle subunit SRP54